MPRPLPAQPRGALACASDGSIAVVNAFYAPQPGMDADSMGFASGRFLCTGACVPARARWSRGTRVCLLAAIAGGREVGGVWSRHDIVGIGYARAKSRSHNGARTGHAFRLDLETQLPFCTRNGELLAIIQHAMPKQGDGNCDVCVGLCQGFPLGAAWYACASFRSKQEEVVVNWGPEFRYSPRGYTVEAGRRAIEAAEAERAEQLRAAEVRSAWR